MWSTSSKWWSIIVETILQYHLYDSCFILLFVEVKSHDHYKISIEPLLEDDSHSLNKNPKHSCLSLLSSQHIRRLLFIFFLQHDYNKVHAFLLLHGNNIDHVFIHVPCILFYPWSFYNTYFIIFCNSTHIWNFLTRPLTPSPIWEKFPLKGI